MSNNDRKQLRPTVYTVLILCTYICATCDGHGQSHNAHTSVSMRRNTRETLSGESLNFPTFSDLEDGTVNCVIMLILQLRSLLQFTRSTE